MGLFECPDDPCAGKFNRGDFEFQAAQRGRAHAALRALNVDLGTGGAAQVKIFRDDAHAREAQAHFAELKERGWEAKVERASQRQCWATLEHATRRARPVLQQIRSAFRLAMKPLASGGIKHP